MYSRETELRKLEPNDIYNLGVILDDNNCWKKLMELIPRDLNSQTSSADGALNWEAAVAATGLKYNNDHMRLIETATARPGESRLYSQILFEEWGCSGRKHERPTVGVLLQLLVKAELYRAADYVAINFLKEPAPQRPLNGPAARIDISLSDEIFDDIDDMVNDSSFYPPTEVLNDNAQQYVNNATDNNKDYYTKYQNMEKHLMTNVESAPIAPPRNQRKSRLLSQQNTHEATTIEANQVISNQRLTTNNDHESNISQNIPKLSALMTNSSNYSNNSTTVDSNNTQPHTESTNLSEAPLPMISLLANNSSVNQTNHTLSTNISETNEILPIISALNQHHSEEVAESSSSLSNDSLDDDINLGIDNSCNLPQLLQNTSMNTDNVNGDENDEDSVPNLSIFENRSSNNDSSLTSVTGTSGENSFDLSLNDASSASNENIPCLSALNQ